MSGPWGRPWATAGQQPGLLLTVGESDLGRVGHCWMKGRLKVGDIVMNLKQSGDGFFTYCLVDHGWFFGGGSNDGRPGYVLIRESSFGAYALGEPFRFQPSEREVHLLLAGERVALTAELQSAKGER